METSETQPYLLNPVEQKPHWTLRISAALCFIGHGALGIITKAGWLPYLAVAPIPPDLGWKLMPLIGMFDIGLGILVLDVRPRSP